ncbi:cbb3-type cytochrome oxidase assembly protein CcoS [Marinobacter lacisalsi]|uniref:Cbb3-type cytochrome oxidase assembly protein CcoS n=1 Tax=Marinobacter lacisalsi TaxID=475979 RepID=A0ABV8QLV1_9GAMM
MNILLILIPVTLLLVTVGILVFNWAVKSGQYDDLEGPAHRILYDDDSDMIPDDALQPQQKKRKTTNTTGDDKGTDGTDQNDPKA